MVFNWLAFLPSKQAARVQISLVALLLLAVPAQAEWTTIARVTNNKFKACLSDIDGHMPNHLARTYRSSDGDVVTSGHEITHYINSRLRNEQKSQNGFYVLHDKGFLIKSPSVTLKQVADATPPYKRGRVYQLYMVDAQEWWNDTCLYPLDEFVAYINGTLVGIEYDLKDRAMYSFDNALEMWEYCKVAQELSRKSGFSQQKELDEFMSWLYTNRVKYIKIKFGEKEWLPTP